MIDKEVSKTEVEKEQEFRESLVKLIFEVLVLLREPDITFESEFSVKSAMVVGVAFALSKC